MKKPNITVSDRGFSRADPIPGHHGSEVRVYESSLATEPALWLSVQEGVNEPATISLPLKRVKQLEQALRWLRKNHYQVRRAR